MDGRTNGLTDGWTDGWTDGLKVAYRVAKHATKKVRKRFTAWKSLDKKYEGQMSICPLSARTRNELT